MEENNKENFKNKKTGLIVLLIGIALIISAVVYTIFGTNLLKNTKDTKNNENNETISIDENAADNLVGIYANSKDKIAIHRLDNGKLSYVVGDTFKGTAKMVDEKTARSEKDIKEKSSLEFKLVEDGIEFSYKSNDNTVSVEKGLYNKILEYSKEDVYSEFLGNPIYLESICSGLYTSSDGTELYVIQTDENNLTVRLKSNEKNLFKEDFIMTKDHKIISYLSNDESKIDYELNISVNSLEDKKLKVTVNKSVVGEKETNKIFDSEYKFVKNITVEDVINEFYE